MIGLGHTSELILLLLVAVLIFGPKRIPEIAGSVGKTMKSFRGETQDLRAEVRSARQELVSIVDVNATAESPPRAHATTDSNERGEELA